MRSPLSFLIACCLFGTSASATLTSGIVYCDATNGNDDGPNVGVEGDSSKPFKTVYAAIDAAQPGDTVIVRPGTYRIENGGGPPYITREVHICGEPGAILFDYDAAEAPLLFFSGSAAAHSTVDGLTLDGNWTNSSPGGTNQGLIDVDGTSSVTVRNCVLRNEKYSGVRIGDSKDCVVEHCQISAVSIGIAVQGNSDRVQLANNSIQNGNDVSAGIGIDFHPDDSGSATQATVTDNQIGSGFLMGIQVYGVEDRVLVAHNAITGTPWGISFDHPNDSLIDGNTIYATTFIGIELADGCQHITASNNVIRAQSGAGYSITSIASGSSYTPSVAINIIGGEASTNSENLVHVFAQNDVHISGGTWTAGSDGNAPFEFQGSGRNSIVGATVNLNNSYCVMDIEDQGTYAGTDFRDNLIIGTPAACVLSYYGPTGDSEISGNHLVSSGPFPAGFSFVRSGAGAALNIKNNAPEDPANLAGFPATPMAATFTATSSDMTTDALVLANNGGDNGPGQGVGISFCPYSSGAELSSIRSVIQAYSYAPANLQFWTSGATGGEHMVASFNYDLTAAFAGTVTAPSMNTAATTLTPVAPGTITTPSTGVTLYTSSADGKLYARDSQGNDHALF